jgi:hypothetical protein
LLNTDVRPEESAEAMTAASHLRDFVLAQESECADVPNMTSAHGDGAHTSGPAGHNQGKSS